MPVKSWSVIARSLGDGLALRCPACRSAPMFTSFWDMYRACPACGAVFEPRRGEFTGALMLAQGTFGAVALLGYLLLFVFTSIPPALQLAWLLGFGFLLPLAFYRNVKGLWVGIMHAAAGLKAGEVEEHLTEPPGAVNGE